MCLDTRVAGTKAAIPEMLESTFEHEILHEGEVQCHMILFWETWNIATFVQN